MRGRNNGGGGGGNNNNNNNNNNRKGPNPLTRNYESNGPDVKIRGSAQQIAEKYTTLARDAMSSGDRVVAENYLQHAEHYNRIIAAAQAQMPIQQAQNNRDDMDEDGEDDQFGYEGGQGGNLQNNGGANGHGDSQNYSPQQSSQPAAGGTGPQPVIEGTPAEVALNPEASGQGGRHRDRRPNPPQPEVRAEAGEQPPVPAGDEQGQPRRGRRPRRGERSRGEFGAAEGGEAPSGQLSEADAQAPQPAPVAETPDGKAALAAFGD
jgi:hypothetical protein